MSDHLILAVNPGSTSDEVAVFRGLERIAYRQANYAPADLAPFDGQRITAQLPLRRAVALQTLADIGLGAESLDAAIGRGGVLHAVEGGTYRVDDPMIADLEAGVNGDHPSNLGGLIAHELMAPHGKPAFIADPVVVDELEPLARYSGLPEAPRLSIFHALNQKRVARQVARALGKAYHQARLVVVHAGGGISVGVHRDGRAVDVNNALDGEGPFTPQRAGGVPSGQLVRLCFSGRYTEAQVKHMLKGGGGLVAYTGTSDLRVIGRLVRGDALTPEERVQLRDGLTPEQAREAVDAMVYHIAKEVGAAAMVLGGRVDAIVLTGGLGYAEELVVTPFRQRVSWLAPVHVLPGGDELAALREAAQRVLDGFECAKAYERTG